MENKVSKVKSRKELANEYGISTKTLYRWFKRNRINIPPGLIDPYHLDIIYKSFGNPKHLKTA
jgi:DNA invertase Pin-like site-specific DNA recombinase